MQHKVYLGLGSNLGNRKAILNEAISLIQNRVGEVVRQSSFLETEPWGFESPNNFLNVCLCVDTQHAPRQLLETTQAIEKEWDVAIKLLIASIKTASLILTF